MIGIIGKNGQGKTTLLQILSGILKPDSAAVKLSGSTVPFLSLGTGFQPDLSAIDNIIMYGLYLGLTKKEIYPLEMFRFRKKVSRLFLSFKKRGKTIVFVTHSLELVKRLCDRAIFIQDGNIQKIGRPQEVVEEFYNFYDIRKKMHSSLIRHIIAIACYLNQEEKKNAFHKPGLPQHPSNQCSRLGWHEESESVRACGGCND